MQYSYNWLRELSGTTKTAQEIAQLLTAHSFEVESVTPRGRDLAYVVVGAVLTVDVHPNADRVRVTTVDVGAPDPLTIVCGAANVAPGQKVAVACVGAHLPNGMVIAQRMMRGVMSNGMICAEEELGLATTHAGILVLSDDAPIGMSFASYMGLDDIVLEIDVLPNRAHDCLSHRGMAREICAAERRVMSAPTESLPASIKEDDFVTCTTGGCYRYRATVLDGVCNTGKTPEWMIARLAACGIRSVSPLVDVTNYIMCEYGQPLHVFDLDCVAPDMPLPHIVVRDAKDGETIALLNDTSVNLASDDVVITDGTRPIALAGIMGGSASGVTTQTKRVILEAAAFDPVRIRRTRTRHALVSDAAYRYERDIDPSCVSSASAQAVSLIMLLCGGVVRAAQDLYPHPSTPQCITINIDDVTRLLGIALSPETIVTLLQPLDIEVAVRDTQTCVCTIPPQRRDLTTVPDLIEEIGRLYGYEHIVPLALTAPVAPPEENLLRSYEHRLRDLCLGSGYTEVRTYSFYGERDAHAIGLDLQQHVLVLNPLTTQHALMRRSLTPSLVYACTVNARYRDDVHIFEVGHTYTLGAMEDDLPREHSVLAAAVMHKTDDGSQFFLLKDLMETMCKRCGITGQTYEVFSHADASHETLSLHPTRSAIVRAKDGTVFGVIGEISHEMRKVYGLKRHRVAVLECDIAHMQRLGSVMQTFVSLPKYPVVQRDLSVILPARMHVADLMTHVMNHGGALLQHAAPFDAYVHPETKERSVGIRLTFGAADRTLLNEEVDTHIATILATLAENGVLLRA